MEANEINFEDFFTEPGIDHELNIIGVFDEVQLHSNESSFILLKNLSPQGLKDSMFRVYAYVSDSYSLILDEINRVKELLQIVYIKSPRILALLVRSSQIFNDSHF
ncbi:MAG: hypothetical protein ACFFB0_19115 [Promethearchaeota archaeon]